jgi:hypothetical protein
LVVCANYTFSDASSSVYVLLSSNTIHPLKKPDASRSLSPKGNQCKNC